MSLRLRSHQTRKLLHLLCNNKVVVALTLMFCGWVFTPKAMNVSSQRHRCSKSLPTSSAVSLDHSRPWFWPFCSDYRRRCSRPAVETWLLWATHQLPHGGGMSSASYIVSCRSCTWTMADSSFRLSTGQFEEIVIMVIKITSILCCSKTQLFQLECRALRLFAGKSEGFCAIILDADAMKRDFALTLNAILSCDKLLLPSVCTQLKTPEGKMASFAQFGHFFTLHCPQLCCQWFQHLSLCVE